MATNQVKTIINTTFSALPSFEIDNLVSKMLYIIFNVLLLTAEGTFSQYMVSDVHFWLLCMHLLCILLVYTSCIC